jgi:Cu/Ag efflux protein CusF
MMRSKFWVSAVVMSLLVVTACTRKEQTAAAAGDQSSATSAAGVEKTYPFRGKVVSLDPARNEVTVDHEKVEGLWEPMTMAFEVRGVERESLPPAGSSIQATLHVQDGHYWLTDVRPE